MLTKMLPILPLKYVECLASRLMASTVAVCVAGSIKCLALRERTLAVCDAGSPPQRTTSPRSRSRCAGVATGCDTSKLLAHRVRETSGWALQLCGTAMDSRSFQTRIAVSIRRQFCLVCFACVFRLRQY